MRVGTSNNVQGKSMFDKFTEELERTAVISQEFKNKLIQLFMSGQEEAFERGRREAQPPTSSLQKTTYSAAYLGQIVTDYYPLQVSQRGRKPTYLQRKKELDAARFVNVRDLGYRIYKNPSGQPLFDYRTSLEDREMCKKAILNHELELKLIRPSRRRVPRS